MALFGTKRAPVDLAGHAALADDDVAARDLEPAVEPFGETEGRGRGHRADGHAAVGIDRGGRRAVKICMPSSSGPAGMPNAVFDRTLIDTFARGEQAPGEIGHRADLKGGKIRGRGGKIEVERY